MSEGQCVSGVDFLSHCFGFHGGGWVAVLCWAPGPGTGTHALAPAGGGRVITLGVCMLFIRCRAERFTSVQSSLQPRLVPDPGAREKLGERRGAAGGCAPLSSGACVGPGPEGFAVRAPCWSPERAPGRPLRPCQRAACSVYGMAAAPLRGCWRGRWWRRSPAWLGLPLWICQELSHTPLRCAWLCPGSGFCWM